MIPYQSAPEARQNPAEVALRIAPADAGLSLQVAHRQSGERQKSSQLAGLSAQGAALGIDGLQFPGENPAETADREQAGTHSGCRPGGDVSEKTQVFGFHGNDSILDAWP
ncbi:hypothetical protein [Azotobacter salinestris]|uniref:hypothetical protein n=1 Tax=Azotobacter salinestris TaxID=69964 RepID=UPI001FCB3D0C|nr:hypothetical protein [Azotobacter salinestris]